MIQQIDQYAKGCGHQRSHHAHNREIIGEDRAGMVDAKQDGDAVSGANPGLQTIQ